MYLYEYFNICVSIFIYHIYFFYFFLTFCICFCFCIVCESFVSLRLPTTKSGTIQRLKYSYKYAQAYAIIISREVFIIAKAREKALECACVCMCMYVISLYCIIYLTDYIALLCAYYGKAQQCCFCILICDNRHYYWFNSEFLNETDFNFNIFNEIINMCNISNFCWLTVL